LLEIRNPGPDLACNAEAVLPGLINNIDIAIFAEEVAPGQAGRALGTQFTLFFAAGGLKPYKLNKHNKH